MFIFYFIVILIFLLITGLSLLGIYGGYRLVHPRRVPIEETFQKELSNGEISEEFLKREKIEFDIPGSDSYILHGFYFPGDGKKTVVFSHGISWTKYGNAKYLDYFFKNNWNIFLYDHRGAGKSGGKYPSFGYFEKKDMKYVVDYAKQIFPDYTVFGLFGESMGGATVLQYSAFDNHLDFLVTVCPFGSLKGLLIFHLNRYRIPGIFQNYVLFFTDLYLKNRVGFSYKEVNPSEDALKSKAPLFLSHGKKDLIVPFEMSEQLFEKRKNIAKTVFFVSETEGHTPFLYTNNKTEFENYLRDFLKPFELESKKKS